MSCPEKLLTLFRSAVKLSKYFIPYKYLFKFLQILKSDSHNSSFPVSLCSDKGKKNSRHYMSSFCSDLLSRKFQEQIKFHK